jgi:hypothetical protein
MFKSQSDKDSTCQTFLPQDKLQNQKRNELATKSAAQVGQNCLPTFLSVMVFFGIIYLLLT